MIVTIILWTQGQFFLHPVYYSAVSSIHGQAESNLIAGSNLETTIQQILEMGGGSWDRDTVIRALRAAFNNPERAVEYLYSVSLCTQSLVSFLCKVRVLAVNLVACYLLEAFEFHV